MHDTCRVHVFQASQNLVEEVLDELLLERPGGEETMEIGTQELGHKVAVQGQPS